MGLAACSAPADPGPGRGEDATEATGPTCADQVRTACRSVTVGTRTIRFVTSPGAPGATATLVDLGGPGVPAPTATQLGAMRSRLPSSIRSNRLIALEEPWVTREVDARCADALSARYERIRGGRRDEPLPVVEACGLGTPGGWGFRPDEYAAAVGAVEKRTGSRVTSFVGASFASQRLSYLSGLGRLQGIWLSHPFPTGLDAARYLGARQLAAEHHWARAYEAKQPLPRTFTDQSAILAAAYLPAKEIASLSTLRSSARHERLRTLSDGLWQVFGTASVSPAILAYYDEMCPALQDWPGVESSRARTGLMGTYHEICSDVMQARRTTAAGPVPVPTVRATCVVVSRTDAVVPRALLKGSDLVERADHLVYDDADHQDMGDLNQCAAR
ncbi:hypothetical protein ACIB24_07205 [Spongisporangium articulatum]|uniref:Alpha/beta hydrolase n=1 Tax=Spongisporangium articulatum TaxID=3362603 RepID=A0ABW8AKG2_9ACTN